MNSPSIPLSNLKVLQMQDGAYMNYSGTRPQENARTDSLFGAFTATDRD